MIDGRLAQTAQRLAAQRVPFVLATVIRTRRPTSVRCGDCALVLGDGTIEGFVGGVCAESSVRLHALRALETGEPLLLELVAGEPESGRSPEPTDGDPARERAPDSLAGPVVEHNPCLSGGSIEIFLEPRLPPARIVVVGRSPIAEAIDRVAAAAGFEVARGAAGEVAVLAGDAGLIVASHGAGEERALTEALGAGVPYVALIASHRRGVAVRDALQLPDELRARLHTPAGLDIGARAPSEIAISVLAQLIAERRTAPPPVAAGASPAVASDPVCGMEVAVTASTPSVELAGVRSYFCGDGCRDAFVGRHAGDGAAT